MSVNRPCVRLGDYCLKIGSGATPKGGANVYLTSGDISLIRSQNIYNAGFRPEGLVYITADHAEKLSNVAVQVDDILLNITGDSVARVCLAPQEFLPARVNQHVAIIRPDPKEFDARFLRYFLASPTQQNYLLTLASAGATRNALTKANIETLDVYKPSMVIQKWIADQLESLDKKIRINNRINQTLEQMAQTLFKSWFIEFEPVKVKIAVLEAGGSQEEATFAAMTAISGKDAGSLTVFEQVYPEKYAELKAAAELFPSAMQDIDLVKIPRGWRLVPLNNMASFASGKVNVSELTKDTYISTENMLGKKMGIERATSLPSTNTTPSFKSGHILISNIRPYFKKIWLARFSGGRSADVLAFEHKKNITAEYLYNILYQDSFFDFMMQTSKGVKMPRGDKKAIMEWSCIEPTVELVSLFSNKVKEFYSYIESHNKENTQLSQLRDTLLPKLLSGEISLPEAEKIAKEADYV
ncbi:restriction endonuclease subunit S [Serratia liquefaciens]|uniref:restriction endonuclease subunit S n=1 Tax=Serratia liquefaciens TaxID=614 RepID=UPI00096469D2|nr:restriction endonuclease subunit S [Serratia liquefaciens]OKP16244.1 hypothetical protein BSQ35_22435 [Serratia liquefaciens]